MFRYFIELRYKGTNYHGWQIQKNAKSVQAILNNALSVLLKEEVTTTGAGRTDTGVHAKHFVAHFDCSKENLEANSNLLYSINQTIPLDISISKIYAVKPEAHARYDALSRTYEYIICREKDPFWQGLSWQFTRHLDVDKLRIASEYLLNFTDFTSFSKVGSDNKTSLCEIYKVDWFADKNLLIFSIKANRFLRNMVRAIVGTLIDVGRGKLTIEEFIKIIEVKNRSLASGSAPAEGLYLVNIEYPDSIYL